MGRYGVEVEMEMTDYMPQPPNGWHEHQDGSLRGIGYEYVMNNPLTKPYAKRSVQNLYAWLTTKGLMKPTFRSSVHIHQDVSSWSEEYWKFYVVSIMSFDKALTHMFNEDRVGNMFCLSCADAAGQVDFLGRPGKDGAYNAHERNERYAAINIASTAKLGSLEYRFLQTQTTPNNIYTLLNFIQQFEEKVNAIYALMEKKVSALLIDMEDTPNWCDKMLLNTDVEDMYLRDKGIVQEYGSQSVTSLLKLYPSELIYEGRRNRDDYDEEDY